MRKAQIYQQSKLAGTLEEIDPQHYRLVYLPDYDGEPISLALPVQAAPYEFDRFPAVFEGLLPEGVQLEALMRKYKLDRRDLFQQLLLVGEDVVGSLSVKEAK
jgi:serine/threonine-protein kinase HipA